MPLLSLRAYAKHRGVSLAAVQKAIRSGRIATNADGLIDSDRADAEWNAKTRPGQRRAKPAAPATREPAEAPVAAGLDSVGAGGVVVLVGSVFPTDPVALVPERLVRAQVTVTGVHNYAPEHLSGALDFLREHWRSAPFEQLVGRVYPLAELDAALERAALYREVRVGVTPAALRQR